MARDAVPDVFHSCVPFHAPLHHALSRSGCVGRPFRKVKTEGDPDQLAITIQSLDKTLDKIQWKSVPPFYPFFQDEVAIPQRQPRLADFFTQTAAQALERSVSFVGSDILAGEPGLGHP